MTLRNAVSQQLRSLDKELTHKRAIELLYLALCVGRSREGDQHQEIWRDIKQETVAAMQRDRGIDG